MRRDIRFVRFNDMVGSKQVLGGQGDAEVDEEDWREVTRESGAIRCKTRTLTKF